MKTIYLAGPMQESSDTECNHWRELVMTRLMDYDYLFLDPMIRDCRGKPNSELLWVVDQDIQDIKECDIVLANTFKPSVGTSMEIIYASECFHKQVIIVHPSSPWHLAHSDLSFHSLDDAIEYLKNAT